MVDCLRCNDRLTEKWR